MNGLKLLFEHEVPNACLLMYFVDMLLELLKQLLLLTFQILELLQADFILPLNLFEDRVLLHDVPLAFFKRAHDSVVLHLLLSKLLELLTCFLKRFDDLLVSLLLVHLLLLLSSVFLLSITKLILKLLDYVKIGVCDLLIVVLDVRVFPSMLGRELFDC